MAVFPIHRYERHFAQLRREVTVPHRLNEILSKGLDTMNINPALFQASALHQAKSTAKERASLLTAITPDHAESVARRLHSGFHLIQLSVNADPFVEPLLVYYGCNQFLGAFSDAFLEWQGGPPRKHGMNCEPAPTPEDVTIGVWPEGFFPRVANAYAILTGHYTLFSGRDNAGIPIATASRHPVPASLPPVVITPPVLPIPNKIKLGDLVSQDIVRIGAAPPDLRKSDDFSSPYNQITNSILVDVLVTFAASSLCRYHPILWRQILEGRDTPLRIGIESALERISKALIESVLHRLASVEATTMAYPDNLYDSVKG